jgi:hypothetical protein
MNNDMQEAVQRIVAMATLVMETYDREEKLAEDYESDKQYMEGARRLLKINMELTVELAAHSENMEKILQIMYDQGHIKPFDFVTTRLGLDEWPIIKSKKDESCTIM